MDTAKALVNHSSWYESEVQQKVRSLCNYYDNEPGGGVSAPSPPEENRVEAAVGLAQRRIIAAMELERTPMARALDHLNEQGKAKLWDEGTKNGPDRSALLGHNFVYQETKPHGFYSLYFHQRISS